VFHISRKRAAKAEEERKKALAEDMLNIAPGLMGQDPNARQSYADQAGRMSFADGFGGAAARRGTAAGDGGFRSMARKSISFVNTTILGGEPDEPEPPRAARRGTAVDGMDNNFAGKAARRGTGAAGPDDFTDAKKRRGTAMVSEAAALPGGRGGPMSALKRGSLAVSNMLNRGQSSVAQEPAVPPPRGLPPVVSRAPPMSALTLGVDDDLGAEADGTPIVEKGTCGSCALPVYSNQLRKGDGKGNYYHAADCGVESAPPFVIKGTCGTCSKPVYSNQLRKANKGQYYHGKCDPREAAGEAKGRRASVRKPSMAPGAGSAELKPTRPAGLPAVRTGFGDPDAAPYDLNDALATNRPTRTSIYRG
jgi:hypothetical protein